MRAILVDIGNTRVRAKAWTEVDAGTPPGESAPPLRTLYTTATGDAVADPALFRGELDRLLEQQGEPPVVLVSVVPLLTEAFGAVATELIVVDEKLPLPFGSDVEDLAAVGPDRLANVAAACAAGWADALIVDVGTATTFDVLEAGRFRGGWIAPGMAFAARKLGEEAARLEPQPFGPRPLEPGINTAEAMVAGAWHVGRGGVEAALGALAARFPRARVVLTGGLGECLHAEGRLFDPDWTLRGAAHLGGMAG